jgi:hypothetical protein
MRLFKGPPKKEKNPPQGTKKQSQKTTDRLPFFFFFKVPLASAVGRLWTCHRIWAPAAGCEVLLYELVPSDGPFMWCLCVKFFFGHFLFFPTDISSSSSEQQIKFVASTTAAAVQNKSNSHVTA